MRSIATAILAVAVALALAMPARAAFPGERGLIAFVSDRDGNAEIYTMNRDGSNQTNITRDPAVDSAAAFSPDGQRIAFDSNRDGNPEIYTMNVDGSDIIRLTDNAASDYAPAFSPDGRRIAFVSNRDGNPEIYTMAADGSGVNRLTDNPTSDSGPAFSPDGQRIAFASDRDRDGFTEIHTMAADGSDVIRLTSGLGRTAEDPSFSPDGERIAFSEGSRNFYSIYTIATDGSARRTISPGISPGTTCPFITSLNPAFSPDGQRIAFSSNLHAVCAPIGPEGRPEIYTIAADGSDLIRVTYNAAFDSQPDWQSIPSRPVPPPTDPAGPGPGPAGGGAGPTATGTTGPTDRTAPAVSRYGITNNPFVVGGRTPTFGVATRKKKHRRGTTLKYTLSEAATVRIVVARGRTGRRRGKRCVAATRRLRKARKCIRLTVMGTLTRTSHRGANRVGFSGRIGSRALSPGPYQATLTATDAAKNASKPRTIDFMIVKR